MLPKKLLSQYESYGSMTQTITLNKHINEESEWKGYHVIEPKFRIEPSRVVYSKSNNNAKK